jgi:hypothetical protein
MLGRRIRLRLIGIVLHPESGTTGTVHRVGSISEGKMALHLENDDALLLRQTLDDLVGLSGTRSYRKQPDRVIVLVSQHVHLRTPHEARARLTGQVVEICHHQRELKVTLGVQVGFLLTAVTAHLALQAVNQVIPGTAFAESRPAASFLDWIIRILAGSNVGTVVLLITRRIHARGLTIKWDDP